MLRSESRQALSIRKLIPKPVVPLPMPAREILKETDYNLVTHYHPDHFSADYLPKDAPMFSEQNGRGKGCGTWLHRYRIV